MVKIRLLKPGCGCLKYVLMNEHAKRAAGDPTSGLWRFKACYIQVLMALCTGGWQASNYRMVRIHSGINELKPFGIGKGILIRWLITLRPCTAQRLWKPPWLRYVVFDILRVSSISEFAGVWCIKFVYCVCVWSTNLASPVSVWCIGLVSIENILLAQWALSVCDWVSFVDYSIDCVLCIGVFSAEVWFWNRVQLACNWLLHSYLQSLSSVNPQIHIAMPRRRGIPRRGSNSGSRGGSRSRGGSVPQRINPLASASPSSPLSDSSGPTLNSSFHSACFKFTRRLHKPLISATITVIFSEEEDELTSSEEPSREQSHSHNSSDFQGSLVGVVLKDSGVMHEEGHQENSHPQPSSPQEPIIDCEPARLSRNVLSLVLPPGSSTMEAEDNMMVSWVSSPNQANEKDSGSPPQV